MEDETRLSQVAFERLDGEHHDLTTRGRTEIAAKIEEARLQGDISENGDYDAAKDEQGKMEARIRHLAALLEDAQIIEGANGNTIGHGVIVEIRYAGDDSTERLLFGSIEERHDEVDVVVSPGSPLGRALEGRQAGDTVSYDAPSGSLAVEIVAVEA